jgi:hypothetical protein
MKHIKSEHQVKVISVPSFVYHQVNGEVVGEDPIEVHYYANGINLKQRDQEVFIDGHFFKDLFSVIQKNFLDAQFLLNK